MVAKSYKRLERSFVTFGFSVRKASRAMTRWSEVWESMIEDFKAKHGPRPKGVPFLDWVADVESNLDKGPE